MVRNYKKTFTNCRNGKYHKPYKSYNDETLAEALEAVKSKSMTLSGAAEYYKIPLSTLSRKLKGLNNMQDNAGHPTMFTASEEKVFVEFIKTLSDWGFPMDVTDLRVMAQRYLQKIGRAVNSNPNYTPGRDWAINFLKRNKKELSFRQAANISSTRASLNRESLDKFFNNFEPICEGITPDRIINYDETNLTDDPGNKKIICKRGSKYPERIINSSKTAISIMYSGTADGHVLSPYVVYKAEHIWDSWLEGGPEGTRYNRSRSGWFDTVCFEDWFLKVIVPYAKTKEGTKIVAGDNLSSHFSPKVLSLCAQYDIKFICFPPNSTHVMQPLDVAFYAPLKKYWREILSNWKQNDGRRLKTLSKDIFPRLLLKLHHKIFDNDTGKRNICGGFKKCGLYPLNREIPKERLPVQKSTPSSNVSEIESNVSSVVVNILPEMRGIPETKERKKRRKCVEVSPGKSITAEDYKKIQTLKIEEKEKNKGRGKAKGKGKGKSSKEQNQQKQKIECLITTDENSLNKANIIKKPDQGESQPSTSCGRKRACSTSSDSSIRMSIHSDSDLVENLLSDTNSIWSTGSPISKSSPNPVEKCENLIIPDTQNLFEENFPLSIDDTIIIKNPTKVSPKYLIAQIKKVSEDSYGVEHFQERFVDGFSRFIKFRKADYSVISKKMIVKSVTLIETLKNTYLLFDSDDKKYFCM